MNIPNVLTVSRLFIAGIIMALLALEFPFAKSLAFLLFVFAGITDYLDGYLARNVYGTSSFGKLMDPLADKVMVCAAYVSFVEIRLEPAYKALVPAYLVVLILSREFMVTGLRLLAATKGKVISAGKWGKHKTVWQIVSIVLILLGLAVREDILPSMGVKPDTSFDLVFQAVALSVTVAVTLITLASGLKYFLEHRELITRNIQHE